MTSEQVVNRARTMKQKQESKRRAPNAGNFQKGKSGNPGGKTKMTEEERASTAAALAALAKYSPDAVNFLAEVFKNEDAETKDRIAAARVFTDHIKTLKIEVSGPEGEPMKIDVAKLSNATRIEIADAYDAAAK